MGYAKASWWHCRAPLIASCWRCSTSTTSGLVRPLLTLFTELQIADRVLHADPEIVDVFLITHRYFVQSPAVLKKLQVQSVILEFS